MHGYVAYMLGFLVLFRYVCVFMGMRQLCLRLS